MEPRYDNEPLEPIYDDPDIRSRGTFGRPSSGVEPSYDDPNIRSRGSFGRPRSSGSAFGSAAAAVAGA
jgi:hypothetical protein